MIGMSNIDVNVNSCIVVSCVSMFSMFIVISIVISMVIMLQFQVRARREAFAECMRPEETFISLDHVILYCITLYHIVHMYV